MTVTLVDERFVPPENERSNHRLVADNLLKHRAAEARFVPLYYAAETVPAAAAIASQKTADLGAPLDVVVLGMGTDGHTASFFPGGSRLGEALDPATPRGVITMEAEGAGEPRLTFTFSSLQDAGYLVLHIEGSKKEVLAQAEGPRRGGRDADPGHAQAGRIAAADILGALRRPAKRRGATWRCSARNR